MSQELFREGVRRIEEIAKTLDKQIPSTPSLIDIISNWERTPFRGSLYQNEQPRRLNAQQSPEQASHEGVGMLMNGLVESLDSLVYVNKDNKLLHDKFDLLWPHFGNIASLRSISGRDIWMYISGYGGDDDVDVASISQWLSAHNFLPQHVFDNDQENLVDYLIRYSYVFFDDMFEVLKNDLPLSWWEHAIANSRIFPADPSTWADELKYLDPEASERAQKILQQYNVLKLQDSVSEIVEQKTTTRKAKI